MRFSSFSGFISVFAASVVNAHFNITYPPTRGAFSDTAEITFCDGYNSVGQRVPFPLNNGLFSFITIHPTWVSGVMISTLPNPSTFADFHNSSGGDQLVVPYFKSGGAQGCFAINVGAAGFGVVDGSNITLQMVFNGGDGVLYQCVDMTVSSSFQMPQNIVSNCSTDTLNTASGSATGPAVNPSITSTATASGGTSQREMMGLFSILVAAAFAAALV